jgi:biopolymer transport protein ExbB
MRRVWLVACVVGCGRIGFDPVASDTASSTLSLDRLDPGETLVDFPLPVTLDATRVASDLLDGSASNLRFFDASGNVLADEIEQIGPPLVAWVRVPQIVGTTTILTAEVGDGLPPPSTESVWSASYVAVYHLTNAAIDSTTNHRDGTAIGTGTIATVAGAIASAGSFDGVSQAYVISGGAGVQLPALTVSAWIQTTDSANGFQTLMTRPVLSSNFDDFFLGTEAGKQYVETCVGSGNNVATAAAGVASGQWMHLAVTADTTLLVPYLNGAVSAAGVATGMTVDTDTTPMLIGCDEGVTNQPNENFLHGAADEIRVEQVARDADWIKYDDAAQRDMVITYGQVTR